MLTSIVLKRIASALTGSLVLVLVHRCILVTTTSRCVLSIVSPLTSKLTSVSGSLLALVSVLVLMVIRSRVFLVGRVTTSLLPLTSTAVTTVASSRIGIPLRTLVRFTSTLTWVILSMKPNSSTSTLTLTCSSTLRRWSAVTTKIASTR